MCVHATEHGEYAIANHKPHTCDLATARTLKAQQLDGLQLTGAGDVSATAGVVVHLTDAHHTLLAVLVLLLAVDSDCGRILATVALVLLHVRGYRNCVADHLVAAQLETLDLLGRGRLLLGVELDVAAVLAQRPAGGVPLEHGLGQRGDQMLPAVLLHVIEATCPVQLNVHLGATLQWAITVVLYQSVALAAHVKHIHTTGQHSLVRGLTSTLWEENCVIESDHVRSLARRMQHGRRGSYCGLALLGGGRRR
mmetsp:Transcript_36602/g.91761  ORF Transcript_36602/g.91761 Transcript_36602/m.91761 type:complete len:252 (+) Transcript_36602:531-1286(+)